MNRNQENVDTILRLRAEKLAEDNRQETEEILYEIVEFRLGDERFGINAVYVSDINKSSICPISSAPGYIAGVANIRGRTVDVVKLTELLGIKQKDRRTDLMMTISGKQLEFAFQVDEVFGIRRISTAEIQDSPNAVSVLDRRHWLQAVTIDGVQIMDGEKVLSDSSLVVEGEG